jgi:hypothetical protein
MKAVGVCWLPQYHDYGLFTSFLWPVYAPFEWLVSVSPVDFVQSALLCWANVMEKFGATHTAGPHFAYGLLANKRMNHARNGSSYGGNWVSITSCYQSDLWHVCMHAASI